MMIRLILKLAIAALVANAAWKLGSAYMSFYKFKDGVQQSVQFAAGKSEFELRQRVLELASQFDLPLTEDDIIIERRENHTYARAAYRLPVEVVPGYTYPWQFSLNIDVFVAEAPKLAPPGVP